MKETLYAIRWYATGDVEQHLTIDEVYREAHPIIMVRCRQTHRRVGAGDRAMRYERGRNVMHKPDDNEPASYEWLMAVGFRESCEGGVFIHDSIRGNRIYVTSRSQLGVNGSHVLSNPTRRQVRLLCEALGIELTEGKE